MSTAVGPIIARGELGDVIVEALRECNPHAQLQERSGYVRVMADAVCRLDCAALQQRLGRQLTMPQELEAVMPAFAGRIVFAADAVEWHAAAAKRREAPA